MSAEIASLSAVREWLIAAGTLGATTVALYVAVFRDRRRRPVLSIEEFTPNDKADGQIVGMGPVGHQPTTRAGYARLRVYNEPGKETAEEVQVFVERVRLDSPSAPDSEYLGELPLAVSGSWPPAVHLNLPPGVARHFDCVHIRKDEVEHGDRIVNLDVQPVPADDRQKISAAEKIELLVVVTARNANARRYVITVIFDGNWSDRGQHLFKEHLRLDISGSL